MIGVEKMITAFIAIAMTVFLLIWLRYAQLSEHYGIDVLPKNPKKYLYFIPLFLIPLPNFWWSIEMSRPLLDTLFYITTMLCVGFLEELIFRGFIFVSLVSENKRQKKASEQNKRIAILISSLTFGVGHIINLFMGAPLVETLLQVCYATAAGFLFTIIFCKSGSLWPCVIAHSLMNASSVFAPQNLTMTQSCIDGAYLCIIALVYSLIILKTTKGNSHGIFNDDC